MELMMPSFHNGAVEIAFLDEGEGDPIVLVHGFASSKNVNWVYPTWVSDLKKDGRRVIALDNRGHGDSEKLYDSADYEIAIMAMDVIALLDHLGIERADIMGYSLGSRMTAILAREQPQRLRSAILGGIGIGLIEGGGPGENVAIALEAPSLEDVTDPVGRTFRAFADQTRSDRRALAACLRGSRRLMTSEEAAGIGVPGPDRGRHQGRNRGLSCALGKSSRARRCSTFPTAITCAPVGDKVYKTGVTDFLSRRQVIAPPSPANAIARSAPQRCNPRHARAVAVMRADITAQTKALPSTAKVTCREQSEIVEAAQHAAPK
jgi:pimeloyl-ACP methyl ester carboxylesterase